jgi:hypothetical protein
MSRPEWAAAGTFPDAWRCAERGATASRIPWHRSLCLMALEGLRRARVITISGEQVQALPSEFDTYGSSAAAFRDVALPFDPVYLSVGSAPLSRFDPPGEMLGALVGSPQGGVRGELKEHWDGQPIVIGFYRSPATENVVQCESFAFASATSDAWAGSGIQDNLGVDPLQWIQQYGGTAKDLEDGRTLKADIAEVAATVMYFLESANVEVVEGSPTRQDRRQVERKGGRIALTVQIRQPKKRARREGDPTPANYSHRFEVRGHYKHFPVGTRLADSKPERLVDHATLGRCRRIWCPPFVKGPEDKPLVPKLREVIT